MTDIRPFRIEISEADLADLRLRLRSARLPDQVAGDDPADWGRGIPGEHLRALVEHWGTTYDWREQEEALNSVPQFVTEINAQPVHFAHARSPHERALPLLLLHGYPSSFVEYVDVLRPLTDPTLEGGSAADAFHVVIPSLPGFGFSAPLSSGGWEIARTTEAFAELMSRLGYERYGVVGGDIGAGVAGRLAALHPAEVAGVHVLSEPRALGLVGEHIPVPEHLREAEHEELASIQQTWRTDRGYLDLQSQRPATIGAALTDSPAGQLAWIAEKIQGWTNPASATPEEAIGRDRLLTLVSLYWFTRTGASAARFLYETEHAEVDWVAPSDVPTGWAVFAATPLVRRVMDPDHRVAHWSEFAEGGHFPAMETPDLLVADLRRFFSGVR